MPTGLIPDQHDWFIGEKGSSVRLGFCMVATGKPLEKILPEASFSLTNSL